MSTPLLSINIVSYNTRDITVACLRSIAKSIRLNWFSTTPEQDIEVIVVDNASRDGSVAALRELKDTPFILKILENSENLGFGRGHNLAARESKGEYLFLLNTDTIVQNDAIAQLMHFYLLQNPSEIRRDYNPAGARQQSLHFVGPKLLNDDLTAQASCGPYYSIPVIIAALFLKGDHWGYSRSSPAKVKRVDWISGAAILCRKAYFDEVGGFDEDIFMYMEEIEMLSRARKKGFTVWFYPDAQIVHLGSASSDKTYPILQVFRGFLYLYRKHHSPAQLTMVQSILRLKAILVIQLGRLLKRPKLVDTYTKALEIINQ